MKNGVGTYTYVFDGGKTKNGKNNNPDKGPLTPKPQTSADGETAPTTGGSGGDAAARTTQVAAMQRTADKVTGATFGAMVGTTVGVAVSAGCDIASDAVCVLANFGIVAMGATGGAIVGALVVPPFMDSSRQLAKNIAAFTSKLKLQGQHSHHIAAENDPPTALPVAILNGNGMSVNNVFNGMDMNGSYHDRIHTDVYHTAVTGALVGSKSYADVAVRLTAIKAQIYMGIFPF